MESEKNDMILHHKVFLSGSDGDNTFVYDYRLLKNCRPESFARVHRRRPVLQHCYSPPWFNSHTRLGENLQWTQGGNDIIITSSMAKSWQVFLSPGFSTPLQETTDVSEELQLIFSGVFCML